MLGGYLLCLVPLNWLFFRLLRRVEWAWFAAPMIAVGGAILVVRLAQLDIGFVRSRTEIAIIEAQPELTRAHVTRYCGLYTSLTSKYALNFADSLAFALPFSTDPSLDVQRLQTRQEVAYGAIKPRVWRAIRSSPIRPAWYTRSRWSIWAAVAASCGRRRKGL